MSTDADEAEIIKQGWIQKKSRHFGEWRSRWLILTTNALCTYKNDKKLGKPTETIKVAEIKSTISCDDEKDETNIMFVINLSNRKIYFKCDSLLEKTQWLTSFYISTTYITIPISIECLRNADYNLNFFISIPYYHQYTIDQLFADIMKRFNKKQGKFKFIPKIILSDSFIGQKINYADYDWIICDLTINEFPKKHIVEKGVHLLVDFDIYKHDISSLNAPKCEFIQDYNELCPIYVKMRHQDIFTKEYLSHLNNFSHFTDEMLDKPECKYKDECKAYKRLSEEGGNELKDRCHIMIYRHPPRARKINKSQEINSFSFNDIRDENRPIYKPNDEDKEQYQYNDEDGYLLALIEEVIVNNYKYDLCLECKINDECKHDINEHSIMEIVDEKMNCSRHKQMSSPLNKSEMLSIILYTAGECNYNLCSSQRDCDYIKWKWFDYCLYSAINKLCQREYGRYKIYTGLEKVKLNWTYCDCGYFKTYVSTSFIKPIAMGFVKQHGMLIEMNENFRQNAICCDVSWISKFGLSECEILIARSIDAVFNTFKCKVVDHINTQIQHVLLSSFGYRKKINQIKKPIATQMLPHESSKSTQSEQDVEHGLLNDMTIAILHETMQKISQIQKYIVFGFIKRKGYSHIPLELFYIICILYDYEDVKFYTVGQGLEVIGYQNKTIIRNVTGSANTAYHNIGIYNDSLIHTYVIEWTKPTLKGKIIVGIDSSGQQYGKTNFTTKSNKQCFYAIDSLAKYHKNYRDNAKYVSLQKNYQFMPGCTQLTVKFTPNIGMLEFIESDKTIGYFTGIDISKRYHFAMSLQAKSESITFRKYYTEKTPDLAMISRLLN